MIWPAGEILRGRWTLSPALLRTHVSGPQIRERLIGRDQEADLEERRDDVPKRRE